MKDFRLNKKCCKQLRNRHGDVIKAMLNVLSL